MFVSTILKIFTRSKIVRSWLCQPTPHQEHMILRHSQSALFLFIILRSIKKKHIKEHVSFSGKGDAHVKLFVWSKNPV